MSTIEDNFLRDANKELLDTILNYDSPIFCSKKRNLTIEEAKELAGRAIHTFIDTQLGGIFLANELEKMR